MRKSLPIDVLILGSTVTGSLTCFAAVQGMSAFLASLALINLSTAAFLFLVVRPLVLGRAAAVKPAWIHTSLLVLFASSAAAFWIEYLTLSTRLGALTAALTWTVAGLLYGLSLVIKPKVPAPQAAPAEAVAAA